MANRPETKAAEINGTRLGTTSGRHKKKLLVITTGNLLNLKSNTMKNTLQRYMFLCYKTYF